MSQMRCLDNITTNIGLTLTEKRLLCYKLDSKHINIKDKHFKGTCLPAIPNSLRILKTEKKKSAFYYIPHVFFFC